MAADRPACARLLAVAPAGRSAACYTITRDTTIIYNARGLEQRDRSSAEPFTTCSVWNSEAGSSPEPFTTCVSQPSPSGSPLWASSTASAAEEANANPRYGDAPHFSPEVLNRPVNPSDQQFEWRELCLRAPLIFLEGKAGEEMRDGVAWQRT